MYKVEINRKGKKKYTMLTTTDANLNQNRLGHAEYCMHTPPEAIFVVGKNRAQLNRSPNKHAQVIILITCFFVNEVL